MGPSEQVTTRGSLGRLYLTEVVGIIVPVLSGGVEGGREGGRKGRCGDGRLHGRLNTRERALTDKGKRPPERPSSFNYGNTGHP